MTSMNATRDQIPPQNARSNADHSSVDSLASETDRLSKSADWWNNRYLLLGFLLVVIAGVAAYFQYMAVNEARRLAEKETELSQAKESLLNQNLKDKDVQIGQLERMLKR